MNIPETAVGMNAPVTDEPSRKDRRWFQRRPRRRHRIRKPYPGEVRNPANSPAFTHVLVRKLASYMRVRAAVRLEGYSDDHVFSEKEARQIYELLIAENEQTEH